MDDFEKHPSMIWVQTSHDRLVFSHSFYFRPSWDAWNDWHILEKMLARPTTSWWWNFMASGNPNVTLLSRELQEVFVDPVSTPVYADACGKPSLFPALAPLSARAFARWSQGLWVIKILHDSSPCRADKNGLGWSETGVEPMVFPWSHQAEWLLMGSVCWALARPCIKFRDARLYSLLCVLWKGYLLLVSK